MAVKTYDNFFLSNEIEDNYKSHLDLSQFFTVDNNLEGTPGLIRRINIYGAEGEAENVAEGEGNTSEVSTTLTTKDYTILTAQAKFVYNDENELADPVAVQTGATYLGTALFNKVNDDIYAALGTTTQTVSAETPDFDAFVDAMATLDIRDVNAGADDYLNSFNAFAFLSRTDVAKARKALKDTLQYVEAFARSGYVGTVAGVNLYVKQDATDGEIIVATKEAATLFNKTGVELEQLTNGNRAIDDANVRKNAIYARKYYIAALTNEAKACKITLSGNSTTTTKKASKSTTE